MNQPSSWTDEESVQRLVEILRFETVSALGHRNGSYTSCAEWLVEVLSLTGIDFVGVLPESVPNKPIVIAEWKGRDKSLPCVLLNSHYDVVPVMSESWTVPAFEGFRDRGRVYGRGAQDMKSVCVQYIVALQRLKAEGYVPQRTIRLTFVPDEEIGGGDGMGVLMQSHWFNTCPIGLALDEGLASESDVYSVFYGERLPWWVKVTARGNTGHASRFIESTAVAQIIGVAQRALVFREEQRSLLHGDEGGRESCACSHSVAAKKKVLGDVTSLNITLLKTGLEGQVPALNVVPAVAEAVFDIRISPHTEPQSVRQMVDRWCAECSALPSEGTYFVDTEKTHTSEDQTPSLKWEYVANKMQVHHTTSTDPSVNPWWAVFAEAIDAGVEPLVFPAATDSRFLRAVGIRAFGFSPIRKSPILLHEHNEYLDETIFLEGCSVYCKLISHLANQSFFEADQVVEHDH